MMQMRHYEIYKFYDRLFCDAESDVVYIWTEDLMMMTTKKMMLWASRGLFQDVFCVGKLSHWEGGDGFLKSLQFPWISDIQPSRHSLALDERDDNESFSILTFT